MKKLLFLLLFISTVSFAKTINWLKVKNIEIQPIGYSFKTVSVTHNKNKKHYLKNTKLPPIITLELTAKTITSDTAIITSNKPTTFCAGDSITLTSNYNNCVWSTGQTTQSIKIFNSGNYYVTNNYFNGAVISAITQVSVSPVPSVSYFQPIVPICLTTLTFTLAQGSPTSGIYNGDGVVGNTFNPNAAGSGYHTITYQVEDLTTSCIGSATQTVFIEYNPTVFIGNAGIICQGDSNVISQTIEPFGIWNTGQTSELIIVNQTGSFYVTQTNNCGYTINSNTVSTTVVPIPSQPTINQVGNNLVASSGGVTTYWYFNGGIIGGANSSTYTPTQSGNYTVVITNFYGCYSSSNVYTFINTGLQNRISYNSVVIYPNPSNGSFTINLPLSEREIEIIITNSLGQIVQQKLNENEQTLNFELTENGLYIIEIVTEKTVYTQKLIVSSK